MESTKSPMTAIIAVIVIAIVAVGGYLLFTGMNDDDATNSETTSSSQNQPTEQNEMEESMAEMNIVETASANEDFSTLVTAIETAGLVDTLSGEGPFTVFAPTNAAFDKLPEGTLETLLANPDQLASILTYHVVSGEVPADQVVTLSNATTVNGADVTIRVENGTVYLNDAQVTATDIQTSNGIIHVIDTVLIPPTE